MTQAALITLSELARPQSATAGSIQFIGTATVLVRLGGFTFLTDPNFIHRHEKVHLGYGLHSKRLTDPALEIGELPPLDFVLLSHFHGDHFDQVAVRDLDKSLPIVTTHHSAAELKARGFRNPIPIGTWDTATFQRGTSELRITSTPGRHGPKVIGRLLPPVMGSIVEFKDQDRQMLRMYISGDTLVYADIHEIPRRFPDVDLALLHLGGTRVLGVLVTMDAKQGVEMMRIINPALGIPIHYNDYTVFKSPLADFQDAIRAAGMADRVRYLDHGDTFAFELGSMLDV